VRETLTEAGISCRHLDVSETNATSGTFVINCQGEDRRFIHSIGANADFTGKAITPELIGQGRILYLGGFCLCEELTPENVAGVFQEARRQRVPTVLDIVISGPSSAWDKLQQVLPFVDYFLPNSDEAEAITGLADPIRQAEMFREAGARTVIVTCGEKGAVLLSGDVRLKASAYPIEYVDGTGSGDAFSAGFIHGLLADSDLESCLRWGSAEGASAVRTAGASTGVFTADELEQFCKSHPLKVESI
jgi:sugar/nucleoside kinase (ribokinase family)